MKKTINISDWNRKSHYDFFKDFDNPFFSICSVVNVTELLTFCKKNDKSFFLATLYLSIKTANEIEGFRFRIENGEVVCYDKIHPFSTVLNNDKLFNFCEFEYCNSFLRFSKESKEAIDDCTKSNILNLNMRNDVVHYTTIPWVSLTSISHPRNNDKQNSIPKIVFGKYYKDNSRIMLPFSIEVHHSLLDGYHLGQFLDLLREYIINCDIILNK